MNFGDMSVVPSWLGAGIVSAAIAALAYVLRSFLDWIASVRERHRERRSALVQLQSLLRVAKAGFFTQQKQVRKLCDAVRQRDRRAPRSDEGYEDFMSRAHASMDADEKHLHGIIRGFTEHVLHPANTEMLKWLRDDSYFKAQSGDGVLGHLARSLANLEIHLMMWKAKYEVWIPGQPAHALVYLDDEEEHGISFPHGIDAEVDKALSGMK
jgi:hypothetical protein